MANQEHIKWLLEGVESWNARRENRDFKPGLSDSDLSDKDLSNANLSNANFSDAQLSRADLSRANLSCANLSDSDLSGADFSNANLSGANLTRANLSDADLSDADLSGADLSNASLPNADFYNANLSGANLSRAKLPSAELPNANLSGADLSQADFSNSDLIGATLVEANLNSTSLVAANLMVTDFRYANLLGADLSKANLEDADLAHANLTHANLSEANLTDVNFTETNLLLTDLSRVNLTGVEPWMAILYKDNPPITLRQYSVKSTSIRSTESMLSVFRDLKKKYGRNLRTEEIAFYFRGETQNGWELRPSVMRSNLGKYESQMLHELIARRPVEFSNLPSALDKWVLAQHHGLRTRFLDITRNPLVGLFYACENQSDKSCDGRLHVFAVPRPLIKPYNSDTISIISNLGRLPSEYQDLILGKYQIEIPKSLQRKDLLKVSQYRTAMRRLYQLIQEEKPNFEERIDIADFYRVVVVEPQQYSERVRVQSGAFLASAFHERFERDEVLEVNSGIPVYAHYRFTIPSESKPTILEELQLMGITREVLFPSLDESARVVIDSMRYRR